MATVLVIDDEAPMRKMVRSILESASFQVIEAPNGVEGVRLFKEQRPALVITDMLMPDKEGLQTVTEIRQIDPKAKIIAMSGGGRAARTDFLQVAQKFGASACLTKPFRRGDLLATVQKHLA